MRCLCVQRCAGACSEIAFRAALCQTKVSPADDKPILCIMVPEPVAHLVLCAHWHRLVWQASWHRRQGGWYALWPDYPPENVRLQATSMKRLSVETSAALAVPLTAANMQHLAEQMIESAKQALAGQASRETLLAHIGTVTAWSRVFDQGDRFAADPRARGRFHSAEMLMRCMQLSFELRGGAAQLREVFSSALHCVFPAISAASLMASMDAQHILPSPTLVKEARFIFDLALLLHDGRNAASEEAKTRFLWADSSPQWGRNWLWIQEHFISTAQAVELLRAAWCLIDELRLLPRQPDAHEDARDRSLQSASIHAAARLLKKGIAKVIHTPVILGSGQCGEVQEAAALCHALVLLCGGNMARLRKYLCEIRALCSDMGTEMGLAALQIHPEEVMPSWFLIGGRTGLRQHEEEQVSDGHEGEPPHAPPGAHRAVLHAMEEEGTSEPESAAAARDLPMVAAAMPQAPLVLPERMPPTDEVWFMPRTLAVPGVQHIMDNLTREAHQSLEFWPEFFRKLQLVAGLMQSRWRRDRYAQSCLHGTPDASRAQDVMRWAATLYDKRWREVLCFCRELLPLLPLLSTTFDASKYQNKVEAQGKQDEGGGPFDAAALQHVLRSRFFACYVAFVTQVESVPAAFSRWASGCPCHGHLIEGKRAHYVTQLMECHFGAGGRCPLAGKRAAELASGAVPELVSELCERSFGILFAEHGYGLKPEELQLLHRDFERARTLLMEGALEKLDHWQRVPWLLCGLSHRASAVRQQVAKRVLQAFDSEPAKVLHSRLTQEWMEGPLRDSLHLLADGAVFEQLPPVGQTRIAELFFVPVDETTIESRHAKASIFGKKASNVSPVSMSLSNRWPLFCQRVQEDPAVLGKMVDDFSRARQLKAMPNTLGLTHHPCVQAAYNMEVAKRDRPLRLLRSSLKQVIYRADLEAQFDDKGAADKMHKRRQHKRWREQSAALPERRPPDLTEDAVRVNCIREHFRTIASSRCIYSIGNVNRHGDSGPVVQPISSFLDQSESKRRRTEDPKLRLQLLDEEKDPAEKADTLFFRVLRVKPSAKKRVRVDPGARGAFQSDHIGVSLCEVHMLDPARGMASASTVSGPECN